MSEKSNVEPKQKGGFVQGLPVPIAQPTATGDCCGSPTNGSDGGCCGGSSDGTGGCCGEAAGRESASKTSTGTDSSCCG